MSFKLTLDFSKDDHSLKEAVSYLPPNVKRAFHSAGAKYYVIKRNTWAGCAFNAGGLTENQRVASTDEAMKIFGASEFVVTKFIQAWDKTAIRYNGQPYIKDDREATLYLMDLLEKAGLDKPPAAASISYYQDAEGIDEFLAEATVDELLKAIEDMEWVKTGP